MVWKRVGESVLRSAWKPRVGRRAPQYVGGGFVKNYFAFRENPLAVLQDVARTCGDVGWFRVAHVELYLLNEPSAIRTVLLEKYDVFERGEGSPDALLPHIGRGVLTTSGDAWRDERRAMMENMKDDMEERLAAAVATILPRHIAAAGSGREPVDVARWSMAITTQISLATFFEYAASDREAAGFVDDFITAQTGIFKNFIEGIPGSRFFPLPHNFRISSRMRRIWALADRVVAHAERDPSSSNLLARTLRGSNEQRSGCPLHSLLGEHQADRAGRRSRASEWVMGFLAAAPENPSNGLSWGLYLLSQHPEVLAKLRAEVDAVLPDGVAPTLEDLPRLKYTRQVIQEILRLYPGAWSFDREVMREEVVAGYAVPRGAMVVISPYLLHRNPRLWDDPERFDPDRFANGPPPKGIYLPFGAGPRQCAGIRYAQLQLHLMLPLIVRDLEFSRVSTRAPEPQPMFTLRVKGSLPMRLAARSGSSYSSSSSSSSSSTGEVSSSSSQMRASSSAEAVTT